MTQADEKTGVRIQQFLSAENISQAQFADSLGITRASISHILAGRNKPSFDFFYGITQRYPNLNLEWLVCGKGRMYKTPGAELFAPEQTADQTPEQVRKQPLSQGNSQSGLAANPVPDDNLFFAQESATDANSVPASSNSGNSEFPGGSNPTPNPLQRPVTQRKISKIIVLYDDGTFKELQ